MRAVPSCGRYVAKKKHWISFDGGVCGVLEELFELAGGAIGRLARALGGERAPTHGVSGLVRPGGEPGGRSCTAVG